MQRGNEREDRSSIETEAKEPVQSAAQMLAPTVMTTTIGLATPDIETADINEASIGVSSLWHKRVHTTVEQLFPRWKDTPPLTLSHG